MTFGAERPGAEGEGDLERAGQGGFDLLQLGFGEAEALERFVADVRGIVEGERAHDVLQDVVDLVAARSRG